jgi:hypothetical protein
VFDFQLKTGGNAVLQKKDENIAQQKLGIMV